jgi:hypothetical protein
MTHSANSTPPNQGNRTIRSSPKSLARREMRSRTSGRLEQKRIEFRSKNMIRRAGTHSLQLPLYDERREIEGHAINHFDQLGGRVGFSVSGSGHHKGTMHSSRVMSKSNLRFCHSARRNSGRIFPSISYRDKNWSTLIEENSSSGLAFDVGRRLSRQKKLGVRRCPLRVIGAVLTVRPSLPVFPDQTTLSDRCGWSVSCRFCCKSRVAKGVKNSEGRRRSFRVDI